MQYTPEKQASNKRTAFKKSVVKERRPSAEVSENRSHNSSDDIHEVSELQLKQMQQMKSMLGLDKGIKEDKLRELLQNVVTRLLKAHNHLLAKFLICQFTLPIEHI